MKKFIYLAFAVLALLVSSCSKDDNEGSTSLDGDWYIYVGNNNSSNKGYRWFPPTNVPKNLYGAYPETEYISIGMMAGMVLASLSPHITNIPPTMACLI